MPWFDYDLDFPAGVSDAVRVVYRQFTPWYTATADVSDVDLWTNGAPSQPSQKMQIALIPAHEVRYTEMALPSSEIQDALELYVSVAILDIVALPGNALADIAPIAVYFKDEGNMYRTEVRAFDMKMTAVPVNVTVSDFSA